MAAHFYSWFVVIRLACFKCHAFLLLNYNPMHPIKPV